MDDLSFTRQFLAELAEWEGQASPADVELLEQTLAAIGRNPTLPGRTPIFYDPTEPTYLFRAGSVLINFRVDPDGRVQFRNLLFRAVWDR